MRMLGWMSGNALRKTRIEIVRDDLKALILTKRSLWIRQNGIVRFM